MAKAYKNSYFENIYSKYNLNVQNKKFENIDLKSIEKEFDGYKLIDDEALKLKIYLLFYNIYKKLDKNDLLQKLIFELLPILLKLKEYNRLGAVYRDLSYIKRLKGEYELSYEFILKSLDNFIKFGEPIRIAGALNSLGNYYFDMGEFNYALENYYKAFENIKSYFENEAYHIIKHNLANIYITLGYYKKAKDLFVQDLDRLKEDDNYYSYATSLLGISQIYLEEKRIKLAYKYAVLSKDNYEKSTDKIGFATSLSVIGTILSSVQKFENSLDYYDKAKVILEKVNYKLELLKLHNMIGETYLQMENYDLSIENLEKAKTMAVEIKQNFELRKIYDSLYKAYEGKGNREQAYIVLKELTLLNNNMFNFSLQAKVNEVQVNFELEKKELEYNKEREINEYKNNLFSYLTHEFRTPLTLINTPLELMKNETDVDIIKSKMTNVSTHVQHMQHLLNQLLDINKIEEGKMPVMKKAGTINPLLWHMIHLFEPEIHDKEITFNYHLPKKNIQGYFDTDKIEKIISNLLSNALKYSIKGGTIEFNADFDHNNLILIIKDNGIGIDKEHQADIFNKFYRIPSESDVKGSGLGLSFVKELVSILNGEISLESEKNKGSKFKVTIPVERIEKLKKLEKELAPHEDAEDEVHSKRQTLLIVEDNVEIQKLIREVFQEKYKVYTADHGREAITKIKKNVPDLVISDIMMPLMNGIELCNYIKQDEALNHIPVVLLTAKSQVNDKILGLEMGADAYITKPFNIEELSQSVDNILKQRMNIMTKFSSNVYKMNDDELISSDRVLLKASTEFVLNNIEQEDLSVSDLAQHLNMSRFTLIRKFKKINNSTPNVFIQKIRLEKAKELIKNKVANVTEIAFKVGFSSTTYFSYSFKKEFGMSPKEFSNTFENE